MTTAKDLLMPAAGAARVVFLYVGQGESTLIIAPDGTGFRYMLVDIKRGDAHGGMDVVAMLEDLLPRDDHDKPVLDAFVNTHPHGDHIGGVAQLREKITVREVWHSGFEPSEHHQSAYGEFKKLVDEVSKSGDRVWEYRGTRTANNFGDLTFDVLAPADHAKEEVMEEAGEARDRKIHEHCGVLRFRYGTQERRVLITGDADRIAWEDYILDGDYHADRAPADVLSAPHHGSRSFFKHGDADDDDVYTHHLETIAPTWVIISSPGKKDSPFEHPHDDAMAIYEEHVDDVANIHVLGENRECLIYEILADGTQELWSENGELVEAYPVESGDGDKGGGTKTSSGGAPYIVTPKIDDGRPMG